MATHLWNRADISKLRGSSGHDFLLCNSNLKILVGSSTHCYRKEMFRFHSFSKFSFKIQDGNTGFHDDNLPVTQDQVKVDQQLQHKTSSQDIEQLICRGLRAEQNKSRSFEMNSHNNNQKRIIFYEGKPLFVLEFNL